MVFHTVLVNTLKVIGILKMKKMIAKVMIVLTIFFIVATLASIDKKVPEFAQPNWQVVAEVVVADKYEGHLWKWEDPFTGERVYVIFDRGYTIKGMSVLPKKD